MLNTWAIQASKVRCVTLFSIPWIPSPHAVTPFFLIEDYMPFTLCASWREWRAPHQSSHVNCLGSWKLSRQNPEDYWVEGLTPAKRSPAIVSSRIIQGPKSTANGSRGPWFKSPTLACYFSQYAPRPGGAWGIYPVPGTAPIYNHSCTSSKAVRVEFFFGSKTIVPRHWR